MNKPLHSSTASAAPLALNPFAAALRRMVMALSCAALPAMAQNLPVGTAPDGFAIRTSGTTNIEVNVDGDVMTITPDANDQFTHLTWTTFDIANGFSVEVDQPVDNFLLNQVTGGMPSDIAGMLSGVAGVRTDGVVALINPAGVLVSSTGVINVGGLLASSLTPSVNVNPNDVDLEFTDGGTDSLVDNPGLVSNQGTITVGTAGVTLLGRAVTNSGNITAEGGPARLFAADGAVITVGLPNNSIPTIGVPSNFVARPVITNQTGPAISNTGNITSAGNAVLLRGEVVPGLLAVVNNTGLLSAAATVIDTAGGTVQLVATGGGVSTAGDGTTSGIVTSGSGDGNGGNVTITSAGSVTVGGINTTASGAGDGGNITVTATAGNITVGGINTSATGTGTSGDVTLTADTTAGQLILDDETGLDSSTTRIVADAIVLNARSGIGTVSFDSDTGIFSGDDIDIAATTLEAVVSGTGDLNINELDTVDISPGFDANRDISFSQGDMLSFGNFNVGADNALRLASRNGDLTLDGLLQGGSVTLVAGGSILEDLADIGSEVTADHLVARASGGIDFDTNVSSIRATLLNAGNIVLDEANGATLVNLTTDDGDITVTTTTGNLTADTITAGADSNVSLTAIAGSILDDDSGLNVSDSRITGNVVTLNSTTGVGTLSVDGAGTFTGNDIDTDATTLNVTATTGAININEADSLTAFTLAPGAGGRRLSTGDALSTGDYGSLLDPALDPVAFESRNGNLTVGNIVASNISLAAGAGSGTGAIIDGNADTVNVTATTLSASAATGIGTVGDALETDVTRLAAAVSGTGAIVLAENDGAVLSNLTTANGNIAVTSSTGNLTAGTIKAGTSGGNNVTLIATAGSILDDQSGLNNTGTRVTGNVVTLTASTGIGTIDDNVDTSASDLDASVTGAGSIIVNEENGVSLSAVDTSNGAVSITAGGNITVGLVSAIGNTVKLTATGGSITEIGVGDPVADIVATSLDATASSGINLDTDISTLTNVAGGNASTIDIDDASGDLAVVTVSGGSIFLDSAGSITDGNANGTTNITATSLEATALGGIDLDTEISTLSQAVGGNASTVDIDDDGGNLAVGTVSAGTVILNADGAITDGNSAEENNVSANTLTATSGTGVELDTQIATLANAAGGSGAVDIEDRDGDLDVTAASGSNISLSSVGALSGSNISAPTGLLTANGSSINLGTTVQSLEASATGISPGTSNLIITESDGIVLTDVDTANGSILVTAGGELDARDVVSSTSVIANTVSLSTTSGNLIVGNVDAGANADVTLTSNSIGTQQIRDDANSTTRITGNLITLNAGGGIGANSDIETSGTRLFASSASGALNVTEADDISLSNFSNNGAGNISLSVGAFSDATPISLNAGGNNIALETRTAGAELNIGTLTATSVALNSGGAIVDSNAGATNLNATTLTAVAAGNIDLDTAVAFISATAGGPGVGNITIDEAGAVTLTSVSTSNGGVTLTAGGTIVATSVTAAGGSVSLTANSGGAIQIGALSAAGNAVNLSAGGAITENGDAAADITADSLFAQAVNGVDLDTDVATLDGMVTGTGSLTIQELDGLSRLDASAANGDVSIGTTTGNIIAGTITAGTGGNVMLSAAGSGGQILDDGNDNAPTTTRIAGNTVTLNADAGIGTALEDVDTNATTIVANTDTGPINIDELNGATASASTASDAITLGTMTGNLSILDVSTAGDVILNSGGSIIGVGAGPDVSAGSLLATAASGIDLDTDVASLDATVNGPGNIVIDETNGLAVGTIQTGGALTLNTGDTLSPGRIQANGVTLTTVGELLITNDQQIDGGSGAVVITTAAGTGGISQERGRESPAILGSSITLNSGGNVGLLTVPLEVDTNGSTIVNFSDNGSQGFISGSFGSLNESGRVLGLASNSELSGVVGAIQSSFEKRVSFNLDSSQFSSSARIFATEGTAVQLPEDQRE